MANASSSGTSPTFVVSGEDIIERKYHTISTFEVTTVKPPQLNSGNDASLAMSKWVQPWPHWNFDKIAFPLYDGVCQFLGTPSNRPDFIKDYHFIGIMRNVDIYLAPTYSSYIVTKTEGVGAASPPTPSSRGL